MQAKKEKLAWIDEQAGDFLAFIMVELITKWSFFLEETRNLFLAFSPMLRKRVRRFGGDKIQC